MESLIIFLGEHWGTMAMVAGVVISIINAFSKHWTAQDKWYKKMFFWITEILSFLSSAEVKDGKFVQFKMPLTSKKPENQNEI